MLIENFKFKFKFKFLSVKQKVSEVENKTLVREKKYHESDIFHIKIMTLFNFGPLIISTNSTSLHPGFSEAVKNIRGSNVNIPQNCHLK